MAIPKGYIRKIIYLMPDSRPRLFNIPKEISPIERDMTKLENAFLESMSKEKVKRKPKTFRTYQALFPLFQIQCRKAT